MNFKTYRLYFRGNLHLSDVRLDYGNSEGQIHSDTLQAAIIAALAAVGLSPASGNLPFAVSSMFPFYEGGADPEIHYFFPKPFLRFKIPEKTTNFTKKMKQVRWMDQSYFEKVINGEDIGDFGGSEQPHLQGAWLHGKELESPIMFSQTLPRVRVPREYEHPDKKERETQIFYMEMIRFQDKSGFYFLAHGKENDLKLLESALDILQDEGFGTDRSVGNGHFRWEKSGITLRVPNNSASLTNLSLYCPESSKQLAAMINGSGHYELCKRGGWITTQDDLTIRKRSIHMISEGSVFNKAIESDTDGVFVGGAADINLKPSFPVKTPHIWRSGKSIFIPVNL